MAYGIIVAQLERQYLADRQAFLTVVLSNGEKDVSPPSWEERQATLDAWLAGDAQSAESDLLAELGL